MVDEEIFNRIEEKLQNEIDTIMYYLQQEVETGNENTQYRQAKLFVFAKSIKTSLKAFIEELNKHNILDSFIELFTNNDNFVETLYVWLYESNGDKYDLFMDRIRLLEYIEQFIKNQ